MTFWDFLSNLLGAAMVTIIFIVCSPFGWIGMLILGLVFM